MLLFFAFIGTYLLFFSIKYCIDCLSILLANRWAEGWVIGIEARDNTTRRGRHYLSYCCIISFETAWNEKRKVEYAPLLGKIPFAIGDRVTVWYGLKDPSVFTLGGGGMGLEIAGMLLFSGIWSIGGWIGLYQMVKGYLPV